MIEHRAPSPINRALLSRAVLRTVGLDASSPRVRAGERGVEVALGQLGAADGTFDDQHEGLHVGLRGLLDARSRAEMLSTCILAMSWLAST